MTDRECERICYYIPPIHEKLAKVTIRIFRMVRKTNIINLTLG